MTPIVYSCKVDTRQPLWASVARSEAEGYPILRELAHGAEQTVTGPSEARRTIDFLVKQRFRDDGEGAARMPIELVDMDGRIVAVE